MRRGVWFFVLGVIAAALGAASAYAAGTTTTSASTTTDTTSTSTTTTTVSTTTTAATTTTRTTTTTPPPPSYAALPASYLSDSCVGAGSAAIAIPGRQVLTLGTPASSRGPSAYPAKAPIVAFSYSTAYGSGCKTARVALGSVSLFGGAITAKSVSAIHGHGSVSGVVAHVGGWGEVRYQKTVGRVTAPLVVQLLAAHGGLPAGTTIAVAFGASPQVVHKHHSSATKSGHAKKHHHQRAPVAQPLTALPSLGYKPHHYVFPIDGGASYVDTYGANRNDIYDGWHHGDDLFAPLGTPVVAVARGTLSLVGWNSLGGWRVWLTDKKGNSFYYAHLAGYARWILTHPHVRAGQVIGFLGRTGDAFTTTPHVHFEIHPHLFVSLGYDGAVDPTPYLQKWKVEHVPMDEIPQPARLKAPVGTPQQEATVVWHELLVARHLTSAAGAATTAAGAAAAASTHRPFPHPPSYEASGAPPLRIEAATPASAHLSASRNDMPLLIGGPLGGLLALSALGAGAFTFRRRRRAAPVPDAPS